MVSNAKFFRFGWLLLPLIGPLVSSPATAAELVVHKAARTLDYRDGDVRRTFHIGLGTAPVGPKVREGDRRTPEGTYFITHKNAHSQFFLSLGVSYPNAADAARGRAAGVVSAATATAVREAARQGLAPPPHTALGGDVFIHGGGAKRDWTWGCIALDDPDMVFLFQHARVRDTVRILP